MPILAAQANMAPGELGRLRHAQGGDMAQRAQVSYSIQRHGRYWRVLDAAGELVCLTVYKRGAQEVVRRLCST